MTHSLTAQAPESIDCDAVALVLFEGEAPPLPNNHYDDLTTGLITELYSQKGFTGELLKTCLIHRPEGFQASRLLLVGAGMAADFNAAKLRRCASAAIRTLKQAGARRITLVPAGDLDAAETVQALAEGSILAGYEPDAYKTGSADRPVVDDIQIVASPDQQASLDRGVAIGEGQNFARTLVNEPGNLLPPKELAARAVEMANRAGLEVEVLGEDRLVEMKMGALLGVAKGSEQPPVLIVVRYRPDATAGDGAHLGLVGKAVTFDTGGISIKPSADMDKMKYDMAGGAAMLGAMKAIAVLRPSVPVTAVIPSVENMPSARAQRPGDVVTTMSGKTVEVLNTDAEGRLILADALTYAKQQGCTHLVDAATLTGSIVVALANVRVGAFSNDDAWLDQLLASSEAAGEKMWPMPMDEEYKEQLKSLIADLPNIGTRYGGSITAALFLQEFADPTPWVHLDIAGTAWIDEAKPDMPKGPSGVGVRTFVHLAMGMRTEP